MTDKNEDDFADAAMGVPAWQGFISWAYTDERMRKAFTAETGMTWPGMGRQETTALSAAIDRATGYEAARVEAFAIWASEQWGEQFCPKAMRDAIARKREEQN